MADKYNPTRNATRHARVGAGLCRDCGLVPFAGNRVICAPCYGKRKARNDARGYIPRDTTKQVQRMRERRKETKEKVVAYFGGKCKCGVSDIRCLSIDHSNNDGHKDKQANGKRTQTPVWYARLRKQIEAGETPTGLELMCFNCHAIKDLKHWWDI